MHAADQLGKLKIRTLDRERVLIPGSRPLLDWLQLASQ